MPGGRSIVQPVLIIEMSATLQHALRRLLKARGYEITATGTCEEGLEHLRERHAATRYAAVILGHPLHHHPQVGELLALLRRPDYRDLPVLLLTHVADAELLDWTARRPHTALLSWDDYTDCTGCLAKLLNAPASRPLEAGGARNIRVLLVDDHILAKKGRVFLVTDLGGDLKGIVCLEDVKATPRKDWPRSRVRDIMTPKERMEAVSPETDGRLILTSLAAKEINQVPVMNDDRLVGIICRTDILRYIKLKTELGL